MLHTARAPFATTTINQTTTSSPTSYTRTSSFRRITLSPHHFRGGHAPLSRRRLPRASTSGDHVRELASEKAVESGEEISADSSKLSSSGQTSAGVLDAQAEDVSDAASDSGESIVREKVVDVASDMAVDNTEDVEKLAREDAGELTQQDGRSVEEEAQGLEGKAEQVSEREARQEAS